MKEGKLSDTGFRDQAVIVGDGFTISIITADISNVPDMDLVNCLEQVSTVLPEKIRWSKSIYYECIDNKVVLIEDKNNEMDMLEISLGAGASLVRNTWVPDLSVGFSLGLHHKGAPQGPGISSNFVFDFPSENNINVNTFLNLNYSWTINKKAKKPDMLSFEMGYLISRQGELFGKNTIKLAFSWSPAKFVTVSPQLYISDNFGQAYPGIRVGFGF
jgi:hypothetical protein